MLVGRLNKRRYATSNVKSSKLIYFYLPHSQMSFIIDSLYKRVVTNGGSKFQISEIDKQEAEN